MPIFRLRFIAFGWALSAGAAGIAQTTTPTTVPAKPSEAIERVEQQIEQFWSDTGLQLAFAQTPWWAWITLAGCIFLGLATGKILRLLSERTSKRLGEKKRLIRQAIAESIARPAALAAFTIGLMAGLRFIALGGDLRLFVRKVGAFLLITAAGWCLYNLVNVVELLLRRVTSRTASPLDDQLVPLVRKTLRILLIVILSLFVADNIFGANISSFLAGLGIVGLAISLASQDTVKNFFGSVTVFIDQPFVLGDRIVLTGYDGFVEEIGFRSTKLRTLSGHIVQIPNSKIVDSTVENISRRPYLKRTIEIPLKPGLPLEEIERAVTVVQQALADPEVAAPFNLAANPPRVALEDLPLAGKATLRAHYWFYPADQWEFTRHAQKVNLILARRLAAAEVV